MKKVILIILLLSLFFALAGSIQAIDTIVKSYPELPGAPEPTAGIPQYIRYIFVFSLGAVGIVAFIAMLLAAFGYVTSVGNPQKAADAKAKIFSALLGMLILLSSYLLLDTINPDLLKLKITGQTVNIPVDVGETRTGCFLKEAFADKRIIDDDNIEPALIITFTLSMDCKKDTTYPILPWEFEEAPHLQQKRPEDIGPDTICDGYFESARREPTEEDENPQFSWVFNFSRNYHLLSPNTKNCAGEWSPDSNTPNIQGGGVCTTGYAANSDGFCNFREGKPEEFYLKGKIQLKEDMAIQYVPELKITGQDLADNGVCCR